MRCVFQSTFPRGERQGVPGQHICVRHISIHVPSWGTTINKVDSRAYGIFQSTFPRGERRKDSWMWMELSQFQSTFPRGERQRRKGQLDRRLEFQSTFPRGERQGTSGSGRTGAGFQSTFPRGERRQIFTNILCFFMQ